MNTSKVQKEIYKDIPNYEGIYQVSNLGNVKSLYFNKERILKQSLDGQGYLHVGLYKNGKGLTIKVHILIAVVFKNHIPNGYNGLIVDHENNIKTDNYENNIKLITVRENTSKDRKNGSSKYVGVYWSKQKKKWRSQITINKKCKHLGYFTNEKKAAESYQNILRTLD